VVDEIPQDRVIRSATLAMTALATASVELGIAEPDRSKIASLAGAAAMMVPVLALAWYLGRSVRWRPNSVRRNGEVSSFIVVALLALLVLPFAMEVGRLFWFGRGRMLEVLLLASVRNLGLGLAALSHRTTFIRLSALVSLFLVAVSSAMAEGAAMIAIIVLFAAAGCLWLMRSYWGALRFEGSSGRGSRFPVGTVAMILAVVGSVFAAAAVGPTRAATVLAGLMPTSGGTFWNDPDAQGGVNDGDNEVSGSEKPVSVGFTESEIYLESDRPSLYDAFSEQYGEPFKRTKQERMIALGQQDVRGQKERPAENLRAGRQFPMVRQKPTAPTKRPGERQAKALLYIKGPCPLHLPLMTYDAFDGVDWEEEPHTYRSCPLEQEPGNNWLRLTVPRPLIFASVVAHQIKIGTLESSPLPVPAHLLRLRVGSVNRLDFFGWAQEGIIQMMDRTVPAGTTIETEARSVDPRCLATIDFTSTSVRSPECYLAFSDRYQVDPAVSELAFSWTSGLPRGWSQVDAVVAALRRDYAHDRKATPPADCCDVAGHFLLTSRRGPDYLFATAAAVVLRSLGYGTRIVSGFYASPERYDPGTRHTPVLGEDVHFWTEVRLPGGTWVAIEPTPGYEVMGTAFSWTEYLGAIAVALGNWIKGQYAIFVASGVFLAVLFRFWRELADLFLTFAWRLSPRRDTRRWLARTFRLVERRSRWAGHPRPASTTPRRWYVPSAPRSAVDQADDLATLILLVERSLYATDETRSSRGPIAAELAATCRQVVRNWTLSRFRASRVGTLS